MKHWIILTVLAVLKVNCSAEVVKSFNTCNQFFYKKNPPTYPQEHSDNVKFICQKYENIYYFATAYDIERRIPRYSAYILEPFGMVEGRQDDWMIEPQLDKDILGNSKDMIDEKKVVINKTNLPNQATNIDYNRPDRQQDAANDPEYDRGHLNAQLFHSESVQSKRATNTLTNIAPQAHTFNIGKWNELEMCLLKVSKKHCKAQGANVFVITGVKPSKDQNGTNKLNGRVNIPSNYWTAICCSEQKSKALWSAGFIAENVADVNTEILYGSVSELKSKIGFHTLFKDGCKGSVDILEVAKDSFKTFKRLPMLTTKQEL